MNDPRLGEIFDNDKLEEIADTLNYLAKQIKESSSVHINEFKINRKAKEIEPKDGWRQFEPDKSIRININMIINRK